VNQVKSRNGFDDDDSTMNIDIGIIKPHRSTIRTWMQPVVTDRVAWSVCRSFTIVSPAKTAEPIEISFGIWTGVGPRKQVLDEGAHWRHLANTIEPSMCGSDAAFLPNYFDHLLLLLMMIMLLLLYYFNIKCRLSYLTDMSFTAQKLCVRSNLHFGVLSAQQ